jgi:hypothetical protein
MILSLFSFLFCHRQDKKEAMDLKEYEYKNDKRKVYGLDVTIPGPYEAYVNDIMVEKNNETGMHNTLININQAILKSGTYRFRIKVYPEPQEAEKGGIQPTTLAFLKVGLAKYEKIPVGEGAMPDTYEYVQSYPIPKIDKPIPYYEVKGEFTAEVPYELEGWNKGQDLSKMDQKLLQQQVVTYYQKLWNILNNGEGKRWGELTQRRRQETLIFHYFKKEELEKSMQDEVNKVSKLCKDMMLPLDDYDLKIYGNGKIVTLERKNHTEIINSRKIDLKGKSPLMRKAKIEGIGSYSIKLYLPEGSNDFVIIRK